LLQESSQQLNNHQKLSPQRKIPNKLAKAKPPKCAGCLFGAMNKIPWRGRETKASHKVFWQPSQGDASPLTK
jgi:hypothetical protein